MDNEKDFEELENSIYENDDFEWTDLSGVLENVNEGKKDLLDEFVPIDEFISEYKRRVEEKYMNGEKL